MWAPGSRSRACATQWILEHVPNSAGLRRVLAAGVVRHNRALCNGLRAAIFRYDEAPFPTVRQVHKPGQSLSIPNLITLARILAVPVIIWAITSGEMQIAFALFLAAGLSDLVDGFLAKRFGMATELGAFLDPLADKAMIVSIYVALGIVEAMPRWLVILVVSRDIMIVSAVILSWLVDKPVKPKPLTVSKLNTVAQIVLATVVLATLAFRWNIPLVINALMALVAALTLLSIAFYVAEWMRHMNAVE